MNIAINHKAAFLFGVPKKNIFESPDLTLHEAELYEASRETSARILRQLTIIRSQILQKWDSVCEEYEKQGRALAQCTCTEKPVAILVKDKVWLGRKASLIEALEDLNKRIHFLVLNDLPENYLPGIGKEKLLCLADMPKSTESLLKEKKEFSENLFRYPYGVYLNLHPEEDEFVHMFDTSEKFLECVEKRTTVLREGSIGDGTIVVVDCENSLPHRFYSMIEKTDRSKIRKIYLIDDDHTADQWDDVENLLKKEGFYVIHKEVDRLVPNKSLVDFAIMSTIYDEYYQNKEKHFLCVTSDSDIGAVFSALPDCTFTVATSHASVANRFVTALNESGIECIWLDNPELDMSEANTKLKNETVKRIANEMLGRVDLVPIRDRIAEEARSEFNPSRIKTKIEGNTLKIYYADEPAAKPVPVTEVSAPAAEPASETNTTPVKPVYTRPVFTVNKKNKKKGKKKK